MPHKGTWQRTLLVAVLLLVLPGLLLLLPSVGAAWTGLVHMAGIALKVTFGVSFWVTYLVSYTLTLVGFYAILGWPLYKLSQKLRRKEKAEAA